MAAESVGDLNIVEASTCQECDLVWRIVSKSIQSIHMCYPAALRLKSILPAQQYSTSPLDPIHSSSGAPRPASASKGSQARAGSWRPECRKTPDRCLPRSRVGQWKTTTSAMASSLCRIFTTHVPRSRCANRSGNKHVLGQARPSKHICDCTDTA